MSSALAIASVTAVLKDLLNNGLIDNDINKVVSGEVTVSALSPDKLESTAANAPSQLNLFLYNVSPNCGWRNREFPSHDARGDRISNPPLALNLHYLLTAYGQQELDAEILLGYGMQLLHETPVLSRAAIRRSLMPPTPVGGGTSIPEALRDLSTSELAEQFEQIRITPEYLSVEEISKLWTAFGSKYRPTAGYLITVVLIESQQSTRTPLPVLSRNLYVRTFRQPFIQEVLSQKKAGDPILRNEPFLVEQNLVLRGEQLKGDLTIVRISGTELVPDPANVSGEQIIVEIPTTLKAGVQGVQVIHRIPMGYAELAHTGIESNMVSFVLRPRITGKPDVKGVTGTGSDPRAANVDLTVAPDVYPSQRVRLLLNEMQEPASVPSSTPPSAHSFALPNPNAISSVASIPPAPTGKLRFPVSGVKAGKYLVRVQIDGSESIPKLGAGGVFDGPVAEIA